MVGDAMHSLKSFEKQGKQFDFIALDADKPGSPRLDFAAGPAAGTPFCSPLRSTIDF